MNYRDIAREQLRFDEDEVLHAYQDHLGYWTIGVGRMIDKRLGGGLTKEESAYLLENDLDRNEATARKFFPAFDTLTDKRKAVLLNMAHVLREKMHAFKGFRAALEAKAYHQAAEEMCASKWHDQAKNRVERLAKKMMEG